MSGAAAGLTKGHLAFHGGIAASKMQDRSKCLLRDSVQPLPCSVRQDWSSALACQNLRRAGVRQHCTFSSLEVLR